MGLIPKCPSGTHLLVTRVQEATRVCGKPWMISALCRVQASWPSASNWSPSDCFLFYEYNVRRTSVVLALPTLKGEWEAQPRVTRNEGTTLSHICPLCSWISCSNLQQHLKIFLTWNCLHISSLLLLSPERQDWGLVRILNDKNHNTTNNIYFVSFYYIPGTVPSTADILFPLLTTTSAGWQIFLLLFYLTYE